jgi:hypothetical protein
LISWGFELWTPGGGYPVEVGVVDMVRVALVGTGSVRVFGRGRTGFESESRLT